MNVCFNGEFYATDALLLTAANRGFKYGDGLFETMKVYAGQLLLGDYHFDRLLSGLQTLQIEVLEQNISAVWSQKIIELCSRNSCLQLARVRLAVYREAGNAFGYVIEAIPLDEAANNWKENGMMLTVYPDARKPIDALANLKSANYLPYLMAARYATTHNADDALVLNSAGRLCDTSRANIFLVKNKTLYTPALTEGCVAGVMRRVVIETAHQLNSPVHETNLSTNDLRQADEVFLTNAIQLIRWVDVFQKRRYSHKHEQTRKIFEAVKATVFA